MKKREEEEEEEEKAAILWDCGSSLYDSYEIVSLGHLLERNMMALPLFCDSGTTSLSSSENGLRESRSAVAISVDNSLRKRRMNVEMNEMAKRLRRTFSVIFCRKV
jgi:hypothetical protein